MAFVSSIVLYFGLKRQNAIRDAKYGRIEEAEVERIVDEKMAEGGRSSVGVVHDLEDEAYLRRWGLEGMSKEEIVELGDDVSPPHSTQEDVTNGCCAASIFPIYPIIRSLRVRWGCSIYMSRDYA